MYDPAERAKAVEAEFEQEYTLATKQNRERTGEALWAAWGAYYTEKDAGGDRLSCLEAQIATFRSLTEKMDAIRLGQGSASAGLREALKRAMVPPSSER